MVVDWWWWAGGDYFSLLFILGTKIRKKAKNQDLIKEMNKCQNYIGGIQSRVENVRQKIWTPIKGIEKAMVT